MKSTQKTIIEQIGFWMLVTMTVTSILACIGILFIGVVGAGVWFRLHRTYTDLVAVLYRW